MDSNSKIKMWFNLTSAKALIDAFEQERNTEERLHQ